MYDRMSGIEKGVVHVNPYLKATKRQKLEYIRREMWIETWQLAARFNYSPATAKKRLYELRTEGLVENKASKGKWNLTEMGYRRLEYYESKENHNKRT
jgi:Mn-dependent DtxR family transcriptional regulator